MKLIEYECEQCHKKTEEVFMLSEAIPEEMDCPCGGKCLKTSNIKDNCHRVRIQDKAIGSANPLRGLGERGRYNG
jgi:hypothetical protein